MASFRSMVFVVALVACGDPADDTDGNTSIPDPDHPAIIDTDGDGVEDLTDNCTAAANPDQADIDSDGVGDACDGPADLDADAIADNVDNCPAVANADQADGDADGYGDLCDNCPADNNADQMDSDVDGFGDACPCMSCSPGQWCTEHPDPLTHPAQCLDSCPTTRQGTGSMCCPLGTKWDETAGDCLLGDVYVEQSRIVDSLELEQKTFNDASCEVVEGCVNGTGARQLLRFDTTTPNIGVGDLFLGKPEDVDDIFVWSDCHQHYHLETYAQYELVDAEGVVVAPGHKQAFCLMDFEPWASGLGWRDAVYHCGNQGISVGFADTYDSYLDCQFIDVTGVPEGDYVLRVSLNYEHLLAESDYTNNVTAVPVHLPGQ